MVHVEGVVVGLDPERLQSARNSDVVEHRVAVDCFHANLPVLEQIHAQVVWKLASQNPKFTDIKSRQLPANSKTPSGACMRCRPRSTPLLLKNRECCCISSRYSSLNLSLRSLSQQACMFWPETARSESRNQSVKYIAFVDSSNRLIFINFLRPSPFLLISIYYCD